MIVPGSIIGCVEDFVSRFKERTTLIECFSLVKPVRTIMVLAQASSYPSGIDVFLAMCHLGKYVLCVTSPLRLYDPSQPGYSPGNVPPGQRTLMQPQALTIITQSMLQYSLETYFLGAQWDTAMEFFRDSGVSPSTIQEGKVSGPLDEPERR